MVKEGFDSTVSEPKQIQPTFRGIPSGKWTESFSRLHCLDPSWLQRKLQQLAASDEI